MGAPFIYSSMLVCKITMVMYTSAVVVFKKQLTASTKNLVFASTLLKTSSSCLVLITSVIDDRLDNSCCAPCQKTHVSPSSVHQIKEM